MSRRGKRPPSAPCGRVVRPGKVWGLVDGAVMETASALVVVYLRWDLDAPDRRDFRRWCESRGCTVRVLETAGRDEAAISWEIKGPRMTVREACGRAEVARWEPCLNVRPPR